jgi:hypothetical protein
MKQRKDLRDWPGLHREKKKEKKAKATKKESPSGASLYS